MMIETLRRYLPYCASILVFIIVVWAFTLIGSPSFNRKLLADKNRLKDIQKLSGKVQQYYTVNKKLPQSLKDLKSDISLDGPDGLSSLLIEPISGKPYEFKVSNNYSYKLCANFELSSKEAKLEKNDYSYFYGYDTRENWEHEAGYYCFSFKIPANKRMVKKK